MTNVIDDNQQNNNQTGSAVWFGYALLLFTAFLWGTAFSFQKSAAFHTDAFTFNFLRFAVGIPALLALLLLPKKLFVPEEKYLVGRKKIKHSAFFIGGIAGIWMFLGITFQQLGLAYTTTGKSGFLTALSIIILPILGLFFRQRCQIEVWIGSLFTLCGIYLLGNSDTGNIESNFNIGDFLTIVCAFAWAAQVLWLGTMAQILSGIVMIYNGTIPNAGLLWLLRWEILYTGVISAALAFMLQIFGQRYVPAVNAGLIMSTEAIFALLIGVLFLGEVVTLSGWGGCVLILIGIVLAQLQGRVFTFKK